MNDIQILKTCLGIVTVSIIATLIAVAIDVYREKKENDELRPK